MHMTFYLQEITKKTYESNDTKIDNTMKNTQLFVVQEHYQGMLKLLTLLHCILKNHTHVKKLGHNSEFLFGIYS